MLAGFVPSVTEVFAPVFCVEWSSFGSLIKSKSGFEVFVFVVHPPGVLGRLCDQVVGSLRHHDVDSILLPGVIDDFSADHKKQKEVNPKIWHQFRRLQLSTSHMTLVLSIVFSFWWSLEELHPGFGDHVVITCFLHLHLSRHVLD